MLLFIYSIYARYAAEKYSFSGWKSFKWFGLAVLAFLAVVVIAGEIRLRIDAAKLKKEHRASLAKRKTFLARQALVESRHPGTRATPLSSGLWLLTDIATGKTVGEVPEHAPNA